MELCSHFFWVNQSSHVYNCLQDWAVYHMGINVCNYLLLSKLKATVVQTYYLLMFLKIAQNLIRQFALIGIILSCESLNYGTLGTSLQTPLKEVEFILCVVPDL